MPGHELTGKQLTIPFHPADIACKPFDSTVDDSGDESGVVIHGPREKALVREVMLCFRWGV